MVGEIVEKYSDSSVLFRLTSALTSCVIDFQVTSRGQVVAARTATSPSFSLTPAVSWSPEACVTVFCVLPDGEIINDAMHVFIKPHGVLQNEVTNLFTR